MVLHCVLDKSKSNLKPKLNLIISLLNRVPAAAAAVLILFPLAAAAVLVRRRRRASGRLLLPQHGALVHSVALMRSHITSLRIAAAASAAAVPSFHALSSSRPTAPARRNKEDVAHCTAEALAANRDGGRDVFRLKQRRETCRVWNL